MKRRSCSTCLFLLGLVMLFLWQQGTGRCQGWSQTTIRLLSDDCFAVVEIDEGGVKMRHSPHHDLNGALDEEQLIYVIGTLAAEEWLDEKSRAEARKHLEKHYAKFAAKVKEKGVSQRVDLNTAKLTELVSLPNIGPVLAVKIVQYRDTHSRFESIEDIKMVEGIGHGTYNAIRHYIRTN